MVAIIRVDMSNVSETPDSEESTSEEASETGLEGSLNDLYVQYIGEPEKKRDVYLGFGLFFAGIALGALGLLTFLYSGFQPTDSTAFWQFREIALVLGFLGLPSFVLSIVVLLPVDRRARIASLVGAALCAVATMYFVTVYPYDWTNAGGTDGSTITIVIYAAGLVVLSGSTGAALIAEYLHRETASAETTETDDEDGETVTDEQVEADIEDAMSDTELSWGGIEHDPDSERLTLDMPELDADQQANITESSATSTRAESETVDSAVSGLRKLQGGEEDTSRGSSTEDQVSALAEVRQQQEEEELETGVDNPGLLARLKAWLFE